tara:strand:+ start:26856 stop:27416 length:561 start_codon:yes stop_codon:yes gene_type:complete
MSPTPGDTPIDFLEPQFTLQEACQVSGVSKIDLRNWLSRGVVKVGFKHRMGRWMFSGVDIMKLRVIGDLIVLAKLDPSTAAPIGAALADRFHELSSSRNANGRVGEENPGGSRRDTRIIVHLNESGDGVAFTLAKWDGATYELKASKRGSETEWTRRPHIVIPADQIMFDCMLALGEILELTPDED